MLVYRGFALQDETRAYLPGTAIGERPVAYGGSIRLKHLIEPHLEALAELTGETTNLMIRVGTSVRFISTVESTNILRVSDRQGTVLPAREASGGKAMLAELQEAALRRLFPLDDDEFSHLLEESARIRRQGYALNLGATEDGVRAIGVAVHEGREPVAAISLALPSSRLTAANRAMLIEAALSARAAIDATLGAAHPSEE